MIFCLIRHKNPTWKRISWFKYQTPSKTFGCETILCYFAACMLVSYIKMAIYIRSKSNYVVKSVEAVSASGAARLCIDPGGCAVNKGGSDVLLTCLHTEEKENLILQRDVFNLGLCERSWGGIFKCFNVKVSLIDNA